MYKFKTFADVNLIVKKCGKFALDNIENIVGKRENTGYQHCLLLPQCFLKASFPGSLFVDIVW